MIYRLSNKYNDVIMIMSRTYPKCFSCISLGPRQWDNADILVLDLHKQELKQTFRNKIEDFIYLLTQAHRHMCSFRSNKDGRTKNGQQEKRVRALSSFQAVWINQNLCIEIKSFVNDILLTSTRNIPSRPGPITKACPLLRTTQFKWVLTCIDDTHSCDEFS